MEAKYRANICISNDRPWSLRGVGNIYYGSIAFGHDSLTLKQNRFIFRLPVVLTIPYSSINGFTRKRNNFYLLHDDPKLARTLYINSGLIHLKKAKKIVAALEKHGISLVVES